MKEGIGSTQLFMIVISLIMLFSGIMALTINRSNAFSVKDQLVSLIEEAGGFDVRSEIVTGATNNDPTLEAIVDSLVHNSYRQTGTCPDSSDGVEVVAYQRNGQKVTGTNKAAFCISKISTKNPTGLPESYYYRITVFYTLDLPVINTIFNFKAMGETKTLYS